MKTYNNIVTNTVTIPNNTRIKLSNKELRLLVTAHICIQVIQLAGVASHLYKKVRGILQTIKSDSLT
jgi:hypothetical protein